MAERKKIYLVFSIFCGLFFLVLCKAFYVQVINGKKLKEYSKSQFLRESKVYPNRGNIYDRNGTPLAINIHRYSVFTIPKINKSDISLYRTLAKLVPGLSIIKIKKRIKGRKKFTWLARKIPLTPEKVAQIKKLKGIFIEEESRRYYPNSELASQILGFVGVDNVGLAGIEHQFDKELKGSAHIVKYCKDAKGRPIKFETTFSEGSAKNIHLSIDKDLQAKAEKYLKSAVIEHQASRGGVGVMDASTGEILAVANYPTYDPNDRSKAGAYARKLSFISDPFEPGSIFKILTVASALENKVAKRDSNYYCERGRFQVENHIIKEAESKKAHEWLSVEDIVKYSSNIGITKIAFDLKFPKLRETLLSFGINRKTGIELPGESRGIFTSKKNVRPLALSNISFGQGVATTGIQMLAAYASIANGGYYVKPTILKVDRSKKIEGEKILSAEVAKELTSMMVKTVEEGTGSNARIPYFQIAGKTSTAQRPSKSGGYKGYVGGFIGFPVNVDRKMVVFVYIDEPSKQHYYGNIVAAPVFQKLTSYILYKNKESVNLAADSHMGKDRQSIDHVKIATSARNRSFGKKEIPNFVGLDKVSVNNVAKNYNFTIVNKGFGIVSSQKPAKGSIIGANQKVQLFYSVPKYE